MKRILAAVSIVVFGATLARAADTKLPDALAAQLDRIFAKKDFEAKKFGPSRWMDEGRAYTTVEPSAGNPDASEIVRYDTASGARTVLVSAATLAPAGGKKPLGDRRLRLVERRQASVALHEHEEGLAAQHARRLLGPRPSPPASCTGWASAPAARPR